MSETTQKLNNTPEAKRQGVLFIDIKDLQKVMGVAYSYLFIFAMGISYAVLGFFLMSIGCCAYCFLGYTGALTLGWLLIAKLIKRYRLQHDLISKAKQMGD